MQGCPYSSALYAHTLTHIGEVTLLGESDEAFLVRTLPNQEAGADLIAPYPFAQIRDADALSRAFTDTSGCASATAVLEPLSAPGEQDRRRLFPDHLARFKEHTIVDLSADLDALRASGHRRKVRKAHGSLRVERAEEPNRHAIEWIELYCHLREAKGFRGSLADFTGEALAAQLGLSGVRYYRAMAGERCVAGAVWFDGPGATYYHLGASHPEGRAHSASFGLFDAALRDAQAEGRRWANLGGGAGLAQDPQDGLARFKQGWSREKGWSYVGGRILDRSLFDELNRAAGPVREGVFPPYRFPL